tara:strand:+ start:2613 stop:2975 length:363 start_codon:yes stop_codon:yes gene_type:complete
MIVACGVMYYNDKILMGLRDDNFQNSGYWEFPGGKLEEGETLEECLKREWIEELNLKIHIDKQIFTNHLQGVECIFFEGKILDICDLQMNVHKSIKFCSKNELEALKLFDGDEKIIELLQ